MDLSESSGDSFGPISVNQNRKRPNDEDDDDDKGQFTRKKKSKAGQSRQYLSTAMFNISKEAILELANSADALDPELKRLGVTSFNQNTYEQGVISQLERAIKESTVKSSSDCTASTQLEEGEVADNTSGQLDTADIEQFIESGEDSKMPDEDEDFSEGDDPNDEDYNVEEDEEEEELEEGEIVDDSPEDQPLASCLDDDVDRFEEQNIKRDNSSVKRQIFDDGDIKRYQKRLAEYRLFQAEAKLDTSEQYNAMIEIAEHLVIPRRIWERLFIHQQECLKWLWRLHQDLCGGIIADEMGLGKTVQVIAYFIALKHSRYREVGHLYPTLGPVLIVCPATVMHQWVAEFHAWWPPFRVAILHTTGTYRGGNKKKLIREIYSTSGVLITSYNGLCIYNKELIEHSWHYLVLDEGHKIRNPEARVTHCCKLIKTPHRLILSGSPIQNNLRELWSLFDFIYPGKLGSLTTFTNELAEPIRRGGYANANDLQIKIAYKCTVMLRDTIRPYLLRRTKDDVKAALNLPAKNEQVLFCKLTDTQRDLYMRFVNSALIRDISRGEAQLLASLIKVRKLCNHPYLFQPFAYPEGVSFDGEFFRESGKMEVINALLKLWHKQQHKVLLFTQSRQMLDLLEKYLQLKEYTYLRMDGQTSIGTRQSLIKDFNTNPDRFVFLLTTKVGGIGVNLTGASRVIIYDPDWNPCTDIQARERCWRIGQNKDVIIYRLLTAGTVEEKIYHRQIYKQYLTNSVLKDPNHRRFFKINDLHELFTLSGINQTSLIFADSKVKFTEQKRAEEKENKDEPKPSKRSSAKGAPLSISSLSTQSTINPSFTTTPMLRIPKKLVEPSELLSANIPEVIISEERRQQLREQARLLSQKIAQQYGGAASCDSVQVENCSTGPTEATEASSTLPKKSKAAKEGIRCEGKRIRYLVAQEDFEENADDREARKRKKKEKKRLKRERMTEGYILKNLMGNSIDTVLQHDTIENDTVPDHYYLEKEAERIAKEAIENLQRYRTGPVRANTGFSESVFSIAGQTVHRQVNTAFLAERVTAGASSAGTSSASLIATIRSKKDITVASKPPATGGASFFSFGQNLPPSTSSTNNLDAGTGRSLENQAILSELRNFMHHKATLPYQATTTEILKHFEGRLPPEKCAIFKSLLKTLCDRQRDQTGGHVWHLKNEFRN